MIRLLVTFGSAMFNISVIFLLHVLPIAIRHTAIHLFGPSWHVWYAFYKVWNGDGRRGESGVYMNRGDVPQKWWWFYGLIWINRFSKIHTFLKCFKKRLCRHSHFLVSSFSKYSYFSCARAKQITTSFAKKSFSLSLSNPSSRHLCPLSAIRFFLTSFKGVYVT